MTDAFKVVAGTVFRAGGALGILDFVLQVISDGRVKLIHGILAAIFGGKG